MKRIFLATLFAMALAAVLALTACASGNATTTIPTPASTTTASTTTAIIDTPNPEFAELIALAVTSSNVTADTSSHKHSWEVFGYTDIGITVVCDDCRAQINIDLSAIDCVHSLTWCKVDDHNSNLHSYECTKCGYLARLPHTWNFFRSNTSHGTACSDCGIIREEELHTWETLYKEDGHYTVCSSCEHVVSSEEHDFRTAYNTDGHYDVCVDCAYITNAETHNMVNDFYNVYHEIWCDYCGYTQERHVGVKYETIDEKYCKATCNCEVNEVIEHDFDGFVCDNCDYVVAGPTIGVVRRVTEYDDYVSIRINVNDTFYYLDVDPTVVTCKKGDFVLINHDGNEIYDITVLVDSDILDDETNFFDYVSETVVDSYSIMNYVDFKDLIIKGFYTDEEGLHVEFDRVHLTVGYDYEIYDLRSCRVGDLHEGDAVLQFYCHGKIYFVVIW